jgi:hypothetical protein
MSTRLFFGQLAAAIVVATSVAGAQGGGQAVVDPLFRLTPRLRIQIEPFRDTARALGLPDNAIVLRALEGDAKKADPKRIVQQVQQLLTDMKAAHRALGTKAADQILAGADALHAGVTADELEKNFQSGSGRSPTSALTFLSSLVGEYGVPRNDAVSAFAALWRAGATDQVLEGLWATTKDAIIRGANPSAAFTSQVNRIRRDDDARLDSDKPSK